MTWFQEHYEEAAGQVLAFLGDVGLSLEGKDVADIGCGDGILDLGLSHKGRPRRLIGFDLRLTDAAYLARQAEEFGVPPIPKALRFEASQLDRVPAKDGSFDVVVSWSAFEHISDPVAMATEIRRILRPQGVLFLQLWPFYYSDRGSHLWEWYPEPFHHLLQGPSLIVDGMRKSDVHGPDHTESMIEEFASLNRLTLEQLNRALLAGGLRVARLELMTGTINIPRQLAHLTLAELAVSGVKLIAVADG